MKKHLNKFNAFLIGIVLIYGYGMLFTAAYYSHPNAEDLSLISSAKNLGVVKSSLMLLATYDGRYITNILHGLNPLALGSVTAYKYTIVFSILFFISCLTFFAKSLYPKTKLTKLFSLSLLIVLVNFALSPSIVHELYWLVSSYVYLYAWCFWLLWVAFYFKFMRAESSKGKLILYFFANMLLFVAMGINEMFLVLNLITLVLLVAYHRYKHQFKLIDNLPIIITFLLSFILFVSSPGIPSRVDSLEINVSGYEMIISGLTGFKHYCTSIIDILFLNFMVLPIVALIASDYFQLTSKKFQKKSIVVLFIIGVTAVFLMTAAYFLLMGVGIEDYPKRIFTSIYTGVILVLLLGTAPMVFPTLSKHQFSPKYTQLGQTLCILILGLGLYFGNNNISLIRYELEQGLIQNYDQEVTTQYAIISSAMETENCWTSAVINDLNHQPESIFMIPKIKENRTTPYWNIAFEAYFLIDDVRLQNDSVTKLDNIKNTILIE